MPADYINTLNLTIRSLFRDILRITFFNPALALFAFRTINNQKNAARLRRINAERGLHVPAFMIFSLTSKCNLNCHGCYSKAFNRSGNKEMSNEQIIKVLQEASELGISIALLAGGEPFTKTAFLEMTAQLPNMIFPVFTNGLLITEEIAEKLQKQKHVIPVISIEGYADYTDKRRGAGVYAGIHNVLNRLNKHHVFWGMSITLTRHNFEIVTQHQFIRELVSLKCRLFFFIDYIPVEEGSDDKVLTIEQQESVRPLLAELRSRYRALFIGFPGDEEAFGGCLAAGRGFVHISPDGSLEPCPFSPYSDINVTTAGLKEALNSKLLKTIRDNSDKLQEHSSSCALWENRDWVESLLN
ncbi:MAG: radical SAM protein [Candidatus Margulisbacteria bacterium]|nr:radical SAM protein [Candidatus Margulisiibacteriota bacterium]